MSWAIAWRTVFGGAIGAALARFPAMLRVIGLGELAQNLGWFYVDGTWNDGPEIGLITGSLGLALAGVAAWWSARLTTKDHTVRWWLITDEGVGLVGASVAR